MIESASLHICFLYIQEKLIQFAYNPQCPYPTLTE